ncbi:MAG: hypothetical protein KGK10_04755 [Rhodospirillales bacterium]|nr:hypothetical protein [Rhodospirillales bacterium]
MTNRNKSPRSLRPVLLGSAALALVLGMPLAPSGASGFVSSAWAQTQGGSGTTHAPGTSGQSMGQGGSTVIRGHHGQGGSTGTESGTEGTSSDRKGPRYGGGTNTRQPVPGTTGGRPVWAKEGIPAVELGRLSVARAPASVLGHALTETLANWSTMGTTTMTLVIDGVTKTITVAELYSYPASKFSEILVANYALILRIDSPLENLALLQNYATTGVSPLSNVSPATKVDLMGIFLGSASDKTIPISTDTVIAMNTILGLNLTPAEIASVAVAAEEVRAAILSGHG